MLPVAALVLGALAVAALVLPPVREQLVLSASRQPQSFAELSFTQAASGRQDLCIRRGGSVQVRFSITSHLESRRRLAYEVEVDPRAGSESRRREGAVRVDPAASARVETSFPLRPRRGYTATVTLPELGQRIRASCEGRRP